MKISAFFNNIDEAETAVRAVKENDITIKMRRNYNQNRKGTSSNIYFPLYPEGDNFGNINTMGMVGASDYTFNRGAIYLSSLGIDTSREHENKEVQVILEVSESDGQRTSDILINRHGMNVRRF